MPVQDSTRIDPDDLVVPNLLKIYSDKKYPFDENMVTKCLDPAQPMELEKRFVGHFAQPAHEYIKALCQTSILHIVSAKETTDVILSAGENPLHELPPLPFPRVAIEAEEDMGWLIDARTPDYARTNQMRRYVIWAFFISERRQGEIWDVLMYWGAHDEPYNDEEGIVPFVAYTLRIENGEIHVVSPYEHEGMVMDHGKNDEERQHVKQVLVSFAIELAHIITADSVPHVPVGFVSRQQRRQWKSKHPYIITTDKPRIYYVNLAHAGETSHEEGDGSRVYHCRWLVRGHWRHYRGGKTKDGKRTFKGGKSWVRAHVRGPVGAPWKGRPIYREDLND